MTALRRVRRCTLLVALALPACLSSNPPLAVRWFVPQVDPVETTGAPADAPMLVLDDVSASSHLDQRMVWRVSEVEFAFDEANRWLTPPSATTRDALVAALFESGRFRPAPNLEAPTLDVRLLAFDAVADGTPRVEVRMIATYRKAFAGPTRYATFAAEEPLQDGSPESFATAAGRALRRAAADVAGWVPAD